MATNIYTFLRIASDIARTELRIGVGEHDREFRSLFGAAPSSCLLLWRMLQQRRVLPPLAMPKHLMWALLFLKSYGTEFCNAGRAGTTRKTYRKWVKLMLRSITALTPTVVSLLFHFILLSLDFALCAQF